MAAKIASNEEELEENHDINVTPFIDVILVLLIIFMVAAPLSTVDVNVDLPTSTAAPTPRPEKPMFLTIKSDLGLALGENPVGRDALQGALDQQTQNDREQRVFVRADKTVSYGDVMEVMNLLRAAGYLKIGLVGLEGAPGGGAPGAPAGAPAGAAPSAAAFPAAPGAPASAPAGAQ